MSENIDEAIGDDCGTPSRQRGMLIPLQPMLHQFCRELTRNVAPRGFEVPQPLETMQRSGEFRIRVAMIKNRSFPYRDGMTRKAKSAMHQRFGIFQRARS